MLCSLAAAEAIQQQTGLEVRIKWPNDLVVPYPATKGYKKLAGLLTESSLVGDRLLFSVVGMGINVNLNPAELGEVMTPATSLLAELGRPVDREALLCAILQQIEARYLPLDRRQIHADWSHRLITLGQAITVSTPAGQVQGTAESVDQDGTLFLRDLAGNLHPIMIGDVSLRPR
jgi:BirA family biotin operon repressor/biotin-[acetyl-CoA-carboxylase] ligase